MRLKSQSPALFAASSIRLDNVLLALALGFSCLVIILHFWGGDYFLLTVPCFVILLLCTIVLGAEIFSFIRQWHQAKAQKK